jgi:phosphoribosylanthranilate isomerase
MNNLEPEAKTTLRKLGFCGADDSVSPKMLALIFNAYPFVEFGVLFRPDKEGEPRYASSAWVEELGKLAKSSNMTLAAHFCGSRVNEVLSGNDDFVRTLYDLGFRRVQINATAVNGVDTSDLKGSVIPLLEVVSRHENLEFIIQKNEETRPLWEGILSVEGGFPPNITMLLDESKGTGVLSNSWPRPPSEYDIGYAGGIGPNNIRQVIKDVLEAGQGRRIWIDMESSLRSQINGKDVFDLNKCFQCIEVICDENLFQHPKFLQSTFSSHVKRFSKKLST